MIRRRRYQPKTIFSKHNVDQVKKFCVQGLRVEKLLEAEIERIAKEPVDEGDASRKAAQLELIARHRTNITKISEVRLHFQTMMQSIGVNLHE